MLSYKAVCSGALRLYFGICAHRAPQGLRIPKHYITRRSTDHQRQVVPDLRARFAVKALQARAYLQCAHKRNHTLLLQSTYAQRSGQLLTRSRAQFARDHR